MTYHQRSVTSPYHQHGATNRQQVSYQLETKDGITPRPLEGTHSYLLFIPFPLTLPPLTTIVVGLGVSFHLPPGILGHLGGIDAASEDWVCHNRMLSELDNRQVQLHLSNLRAYPVQIDRGVAIGSLSFSSGLPVDLRPAFQQNHSQASWNSRDNASNIPPLPLWQQAGIAENIRAYWRAHLRAQDEKRVEEVVAQTNRNVGRPPSPHYQLPREHAQNYATYASPPTAIPVSAPLSIETSMQEHQMPDNLDLGFLQDSADEGGFLEPRFLGISEAECNKLQEQFREAEEQDQILRHQLTKVDRPRDKADGQIQRTGQLLQVFHDGIARRTRNAYRKAYQKQKKESSEVERVTFDRAENTSSRPGTPKFAPVEYTTLTPMEIHDRLPPPKVAEDNKVPPTETAMEEDAATSTLTLARLLHWKQ